MHCSAHCPFAALIPMLNVLFEKDEPVTEFPVYSGISNLKEFIIDYLGFHVTQYAGDDKMKALILVIGLVLVLFPSKKLVQLFGHVFYHVLTKRCFEGCTKRYV